MSDGNGAISTHDAAVLHTMTAIRLASDGMIVGTTSQLVEGIGSCAAVEAHLGEARHQAVHHAQVEQGTRFTFVKRVVLRFGRLLTFRLARAVLQLADGLEALTREHQLGLDHNERAHNATRAHVLAVEQSLRGEIGSVAALVTGATSAEQGTHLVADVDSRLELLTARIAQLEAETAALRGAPRLPTDGGGVSTQAVDLLSPDGYLAFERAFRGSPEEIRARQVDMLRFVHPAAELGATVLDIGCGRGEWLSVLRDAGVDAYGVDANAAMAAQGQEQGLRILQGDAIAHLASVEAESLGAVTGFHIAEHVPLVVLGQLIDAAFTAIRPGGVLLLQTPNPTNLTVGAAAFYLDPTHLRPLHPELLKFLVETRGFEDVQVHYMATNETPSIAEGDPVQRDPYLGDVLAAAKWALFGPQEYVVTARRPGGNG